MSAQPARRAAAWLAGVWVGVMAGVAFVAAPTIFATLPRAEAGVVATRLFATEAYVGLAFGAASLLLAFSRARHRPLGHASSFSVDMLLALAALFCIVAGHFGLQAEFQAAREGRSTLSFGALHGLSTAFFGLKLLLAAALAWRLATG